MDQKYNVSFVIGTRPEAIKLAPIILKFKKSKKFICRVILTGQHKEMVYELMEIFGILYDVEIDIKSNNNLEELTSNIMLGLEEEFRKFKPNILFVQGDTTSAFTAGLTAFYQKIMVAHVEAGLRTNDLLNPFPEEANRRLISQLATLNFAPTNMAFKNLVESNVKGKVFMTGNSVIDALHIILNKKPELLLEEAKLNDKEFILATVHRRENWGDNIKNIAKGFLKIIEKYPHLYLLLPMHPNPKTREILKEILKNEQKIILTEPLNYYNLVAAMQKCKFLITDSGGLQEEAPALAKPVLVIRNTTERQEAIDAGSAKLIGTSSENIFLEACNLIENQDEYLKMTKANNPFGNGKTSEKILEITERFLDQN